MLKDFMCAKHMPNWRKMWKQRVHWLHVAKNVSNRGKKKKELRLKNLITNMQTKATTKAKAQAFCAAKNTSAKVWKKSMVLCLHVVEKYRHGKIERDKKGEKKKKKRKKNQK